jgi:hypothetical protein
MFHVLTNKYYVKVNKHVILQESKDMLLWFHCWKGCITATIAAT